MFKSFEEKFKIRMKKIEDDLNKKWKIENPKPDDIILKLYAGADSKVGEKIFYCPKCLCVMFRRGHYFQKGYISDCEVTLPGWYLGECATCQDCGLETNCYDYTYCAGKEYHNTWKCLLPQRPDTEKLVGFQIKGDKDVCE